MFSNSKKIVWIKSYWKIWFFSIINAALHYIICYGYQDVSHAGGSCGIVALIKRKMPLAASRSMYRAGTPHTSYKENGSVPRPQTHYCTPLNSPRESNGVSLAQRPWDIGSTLVWHYSPGGTGPNTAHRCTFFRGFAGRQLTCPQWQHSFIADYFIPNI